MPVEGSLADKLKQATAITSSFHVFSINQIDKPQNELNELTSQEMNIKWNIIAIDLAL